MRTDEAMLVSYISSVDEWHDLVEQFPLFLSFSEMVSLVHQQVFNRPLEQFFSSTNETKNKEMNKMRHDLTTGEANSRFLIKQISCSSVFLDGYWKALS